MGSEPRKRGPKLGPAANDEWTLKRAAWAYGCAKAGSDEEAALLRVLLAVVAEWRLTH